MFLRLLLLSLLALIVSAEVGQKRRIGLKYLATGDDGPYMFGAKHTMSGGNPSSLRGRYGKRSDYQWLDDYQY